MANYYTVPFKIGRSDSSARLDCVPQDIVSVIDNLVELAVYTPKGSFSADPDFGFDYWNYEYANVHIRDFNNGQRLSGGEVSRQSCEESIRDSIAAYEPRLTKISVSMELNPLLNQEKRRQRSSSRYEVVVVVSGELDAGLGTVRQYNKTVRFLMEPVAKTISI